MYGDSYAEKVLTGKLSKQSQMDKRLFSTNDFSNIFFGGIRINDLSEFGISKGDLYPYLPIQEILISNSQLDVHMLPYYVNYDPQKNYYYAVENTGFKLNPDGRTEGTYTRFQSLDDKVDGFHYYTWFTKTGEGGFEDAALRCVNIS